MSEEGTRVEENLQKLTTHLFLPVIAVVAILQVCLFEEPISDCKKKAHNFNLRNWKVFIAAFFQPWRNLHIAWLVFSRCEVNNFWRRKVKVKIKKKHFFWYPWCSGLLESILNQASWYIWSDSTLQAVGVDSIQHFPWSLCGCYRQNSPIQPYKEFHLNYHQQCQF